MKTNLRIAAVLLAFFLTFAGAVSAAETPRAQLDESERHFTQAYAHFLRRGYWDALYSLDRALKVNTYLVDYYLLRGLTMNRIGDVDAAREALDYYLEVRPFDASTPRVLAQALDGQREVRRFLSGAALTSGWRLSRPDLQNEFNLGYLRPFSVRGLGKAEMAGSFICIADTLGDRFYFLKKNVSGRSSRTASVRSFALKRPVAGMPAGDGSVYAVTEEGEIYYFSARSASDQPSETVSLDFRGRLDNNSTVADAALLSVNETAIADPAKREVAFYTLNPLRLIGTWSPALSETDALFEPTATAAYGPWLAVADRGGGRVFFLNVTNARDYFSVDLPSPRDVCWSTTGEIFIVSDEGALYRAGVNFRDRTVEEPVPVLGETGDGWTLFKSGAGDVYLLDIAAGALHKAVMLPNDGMSSGFLTIALPMILQEEGRESFLLDATLTSPFATWLHMSNFVTHAVWNNRTITSEAEWRDDRSRQADAFIFHRPAPTGMITPALKNMAAENGADIRIALPTVWNALKETLTNIIVDASMVFSEGELEILTLFCLRNGLELDVWARTLPTVQLMRAAAFTGGSIFFSVAETPDLTPPNNRFQIRIPLPQELASSGYVGRSMLTVYLDVGLMHTRDWIPLWPDLLED